LVPSIVIVGDPSPVVTVTRKVSQGLKRNFIVIY